jgi:hypothetical protein
MADRLAEFITAKGWAVSPNATGYFRHANTDELVNVRYRSGRSAASNASKKASQAAKRAGPGAGPAAARGAYEQAVREIEEEDHVECPALDDEDLSALAEIAQISLESQGNANGAGGSSGGRRSRKSRKQSGGGLKDEFKRLLRVLCAWPGQIAGYISDQATGGIQALAESLIRPDIVPTIARSLVAGPLAALAVADLGSSNSLSVRAVTMLIQAVGRMANLNLTFGWYAGFVGNMFGFTVATIPTLSSLAGVVVVNYAAARMFQEIYRRVQVARGGAPSAAVLEQTILEFLLWMNKEAIYRVYPSIPESAFKESIRQHLTASLDAELATYMRRPPLPIAPAPFYPGPARQIADRRLPPEGMSLNNISAARAAGLNPGSAQAAAVAALVGMRSGAAGRGGRRRKHSTRRHKTKRTRKH